ncbi:MAG: sensor domain-containing diguanylate cyclase [Proteobacteria bacterium]|nr:sensor domain-containing diguanylate cyclase [Pseudomonadota bacterium]
MISSEFQTLQLEETIKEVLPTEEKIKKLTKILLQLHTNYEILKHFNKTTDFEDFMMDALIKTNKLLGIDQLFLFLYEDEVLKLISMVTNKHQNPNIQIDKNNNLSIWNVIFSGKVFILNDYDEITKKFYGSYIKVDKQIKSMLAMPLFNKSKKAIGLLTAHSKKENIFNEHSLPFYLELALETSKTLERSRQFSILKELSFLDELTGLYNRRFVNTILENEIKKCKRYGGTFTLIIADMNNFKKINDKYGHLKGDEALKKVAEIIRTRIRGSDLAGRFGGDEFAIIFFNTSKENVKKVMEDINKKIKELDLGIEIQISLSYGISSFPESADTPKQLIEIADKELYQNKKSYQ